MEKNIRVNKARTRSIRAHGSTVRLFKETISDLVKIESELVAKDGHTKTHDEAVQFLIKEHWAKEGGQQ